VFLTQSLLMHVACEDVMMQLRAAFASYRHLIANLEFPNVKQAIVSAMVESVVHSKEHLVAIAANWRRSELFRIRCSTLTAVYGQNKSDSKALDLHLALCLEHPVHLWQRRINQDLEALAKHGQPIENGPYVQFCKITAPEFSMFYIKKDELRAHAAKLLQKPQAVHLLMIRSF